MKDFDFEREFKNPSAWYRGTPFWSWNCRLEEKVIEEQIPIFREMGFGGFYVHVRTGLDTEYLGEEYLDLIKKSADLAEKYGMREWIYDEDRWASGAAGGLVTKKKEFRQKYLLFTPFSYEQKGAEIAGRGFLEQPRRSCEGILLGRYDIWLDENGCLKNYRLLQNTERASGAEWFAYMETARDNAWYNNQSYSDTLSEAAVECFVHTTHDRYKTALGDKIGTEIPAFFTDEPQFAFKHALPFAESKTDVTMPWTEDLESTFQSEYGDSLLEHLPEIFWELPDHEISKYRYEFHDHIAQRFVKAYFGTIGRWTKENQVCFTGHLMEEPTLQSQSKAVGDAMRAYAYMDLPGVDMLRYDLEYTTLKQAQSVAHQYSREGLTSELYGVTGWDCDFRDYKFCGDWQAALGVVHRVPHLAWMSMEGEAKRDFPASIFYQSPWYKEFHYIEDHFARVCLAMTQGKARVRVGVIHPLETLWVYSGPEKETLGIRKQLDENFLDLAKWLLLNTVDYDYISEALIPKQKKIADGKLLIGDMAYEVILVPGCRTIRSTTARMLEEFERLGGKVLFLGEKPKYLDALRSTELEERYSSYEVIPFEKNKIINAVKEYRDIEIFHENGERCESLIYQLREDGACQWVFFARGTYPYNKDISRSSRVKIRIRGNFIPCRYETQTGEIFPVSYCICGEWTELMHTFYEYDSLLLKLEKRKNKITAGKERSLGVMREETEIPAEEENMRDRKGAECDSHKTRRVPLGKTVLVQPLEPNVLLLDRAEFALDEGAYEPEEEILRIDNECRRRLGFCYRGMAIAQPWASEKKPSAHKLKLRMEIDSRMSLEHLMLAIEKPQEKEIIWNGKKIDANHIVGFYVDQSIKTVKLPSLVHGKNVLEVIQPFGPGTNTEWMYLLGNFAVQIFGTKKLMVPPHSSIGFGDIVNQGFPFYGGELIYKVPFDAKGGELKVRIPHYRSGLLKVQVDDGEEQVVIYPPYECTVLKQAPGKHILKIRAFISRNNAFGPVHMADEKEQWFGPSAWRTEGDSWTEGYVLKKEGILSAPIMEERL